MDRKSFLSEVNSPNTEEQIHQHTIPIPKIRHIPKLYEHKIINVTNIRPVVQFNKEIYHINDHLYVYSEEFKNSRSRVIFLNAENNTMNSFMNSMHCSSKIVLPNQNTIFVHSSRMGRSQSFTFFFNAQRDFPEGIYTQTFECGSNQFSFNKTFLFSNIKENRVLSTVYPSQFLHHRFNSTSLSISLVTKSLQTSPLHRLPRLRSRTLYLQSHLLSTEKPQPS